MTIRKHIAIAGILLALLPPMPALSQESIDDAANSNGSEQCLTDLQNRLAQQERMYYDTLFGRHPAQTLSLNTTLYDKGGIPWLKTGDNRWVRPVSFKDDASETRSDTEMDEEREWSGQNEMEQEHDDSYGLPDPEDQYEYEGIFERRESLTSELIPDIMQSMRALSCRSRTVCETLRRSVLGEKPDEGDYFKIHAVPGCRMMKMKPIESCAPKEETRQEILQLMEESPCDSLGAQMLDRTASITRVSVSYSAAYTSLLQFSGSLDQFLWGFRGNILSPIEQTLPLLEYLQRLPCFPSQCNA